MIPSVSAPCLSIPMPAPRGRPPLTTRRSSMSVVGTPASASDVGFYDEDDNIRCEFDILGLMRPALGVELEAHETPKLEAMEMNRQLVSASARRGTVKINVPFRRFWAGSLQKRGPYSFFGLRIPSSGFPHNVTGYIMFVFLVICYIILHYAVAIPAAAPHRVQAVRGAQVVVIPTSTCLPGQDCNGGDFNVNGEQAVLSEQPAVTFQPEWIATDDSLQHDPEPTEAAQTFQAHIVANHKEFRRRRMLSGLNEMTM